MNLTPEQQKELSRFPTALQALVEAELAAGNAIVEVGHSFPAPPAGAYLKMANKISTRPRTSSDGVSFYERNNLNYSGEFTDAKRFYFVLEPPNPPPPEPDMDAIRKAHEPKPDFLIQPRRVLTSTETATGVKRVLHFEDKRPPEEVQFALERELMTLFTRKMDNGKLCMLAYGNVNGAQYTFELRFEAALLFRNCYSLCVEASWAEQPATSHDYFRNTSDSWFKLWTRDLMEANPPDAGAGLVERYRKLAEAALNAEVQLDSVAAVQQAIVAAMKRGGSFRTSHKEGGTNIYWRGGKFIRSDYGDYPGQQEFTDDAEFLKMLQQFCHWEVHRLAGSNQLSEFDTWKLILRRLQPK